MGFVYVGRFSSSARKGWQWIDAEAADAALVDFVEQNSSGYGGSFDDLYVDRTGPTPRLRWQRYDYSNGPMGIWDEIVLDEGTVVDPDTLIGYYKPDVFDMAGKWFSDEYGRPYNLNDLLADTP